VGRLGHAGSGDEEAVCRVGVAVSSYCRGMLSSQGSGVQRREGAAPQLWQRFGEDEAAWEVVGCD